MWLIDDITAFELSERRIRHAAERKQAEIEGNFEMAINAARLGTWAWYPASEKLVWSDACRALFAIPPGEPVDFPRYLGCLHPDDRERVQAAVHRAVATGGDYDQEYRVIWPDGSEHWVNSLARVFYQSDGTLERFEGVAQDLTARRESDRLIREQVAALAAAKREVDALNVALGRRALDAETAIIAREAFLRNVSHEFRTPLNHILGGVELLFADAESEQKAWLSRIRDAARALNAMVDDTLDLVQLSAGKVSLDVTPFSLASLAREVVAIAVPRAKAKGLAFSSSVDPAIPEILRGDLRRLSQVAGVYVDNAIKFTATGSVDVAFSLERELPEDIVLRCTVSDTGDGIDPVLQEEIFSPFTQADASTTRRHGGLGLASVRGIVALMDGEAGVQSAPGKGSRFWFTARLARDSGGTDTRAVVGSTSSSVPSAEVSPALREQAASALRDLEALLAADDMRAVAAFHGMSDIVRRAAGNEAISEMEAAMGVFDFSAAAVLCRGIRKTLSAG